ncbi:uncharacterized protein N7483_000699 [Penicillium malachiteum]|uniref:uncharacterized protein n=1 Tax=Penicillium malachiteum TaxID=1324776 RepID=UPI0025496EA3|nr:uncharacterized protein N7483_000699 [Penicillium malachiteum]KAJ5735574.1 hypothetical protein N7483_000699 [Penicillium malachiteum]
MRAFQTVAAVLFSPIFAVVLATTDTSSMPAELNFRPDNVTLSNLYRWVGSYYNGSTSLKLSAYAGLAASETEYCPVLRNKTITTKYKTLLALTEPASYNNLKDDPVNAFLTLWPPGFNFSSINDWELIQEMVSLEYALFSTNTLSDYPGFNYWEVNSTTDCGETKVLSWRFAQITFGTAFNGTKFTNPVLNLQFDSTTVNLSMQGYFQASINSISGPDFPQEAEDTFVFVGKFVMTFEGVIDTYHSDILRNDTATPTWLRTVGYQNNSLNVGYTTTSGSNQLVGSCSLAAILLLLQALGLR